MGLYDFIYATTRASGLSSQLKQELLGGVGDWMRGFFFS